MEKEKQERIVALIKKQVIPAIGCTEPSAVALCVAKATEILGERPEKIRLSLSGNIIKNAMGVGIPGTGMIGLPIAIALGALIGKSEYGLEVLRDISAEALQEGKNYIAKDCIKIVHCEDAPSNLYIDVEVFKENAVARAIISQYHTNFIFLKKGDEVILDKTESQDDNAEGIEDFRLDMKTVYEFAVTSSYKDIEFILEAARMNKAASKAGFSSAYGHSLGRTLRAGAMGLWGNSPVERMMAATSAACDARMGGAPIAVMSNSGSGNQGITCTMPVVTYAEEIGASTEQLARALILSHLTSIYIKQNLGALSALCGCVVASTGASSGLVHLMGGGYEEICAAIKNMVANLTGMICDGAKPACTMKISSGVSTAAMSAMLAMNGDCVSSQEGIVCDDVDKTIVNLTSIGKEAMSDTDTYVLKIMVTK